MAGLEAEALLLGIWKNVEDLENSITMDELNAVLKAAREAEFRNWKFFGHLKGIDIGADENDDSEERFNEIKRRAEAKLSGVSEEALELSDFGLDFEEDN